MAKKILLTRSLDDNKILQNILASKKWDCINFPLFKSVNLFKEVIVPKKYSDIIITSKRAAKLLIENNGQTKNAWVVGKISSDILKAKNYNIKYMAKSAIELKTNLPSKIYDRLIYFSGNIITIEMPSPIDKIIVYEIKYKEKLTENDINILTKGVEYVLLYSENCAKTLLTLIIKKNLLKSLEHATFIVISSKVAAVMSEYFKNVIICNGASEILDKLTIYERTK